MKCNSIRMGIAGEDVHKINYLSPHWLIGGDWNRAVLGMPVRRTVLLVRPNEFSAMHV